MPLYSHSQLSTFEECPQKYKFKYVDRLKAGEEETAEAFVGSLVHDTFQKLYDDLKYEKLNSLDELLERYFDRWRRQWNPAIRLVKEGLGEANYREYGVRCIRNYYQRHYPFSECATLATEQHLVFPLGSNPSYLLQGYADRIARRPDGVYEIHDYKTSGHLPGQAHADSDRQLPLYEIGVREMWRGVERVELIWHYVGFDSVLTSSRTPEQLERLASETVELITKIESCRKFPPVKSALCDWCEYRPVCPVWKHVDQVNSLPPEQFDADRGVKLASGYAELKEQMEALQIRQEALREEIVEFAAHENVGVVQGAGVRVSVAHSTHLSLPPRGPDRTKLEEIVESAGLWREVSELSPGRCAEILKKAGLSEEQVNAIRGLLSTRQITSVRIHRLGREEEDAGG